MRKVFIHTNNKQFLGATLAKFAIERYLPQNSNITVDYINVDELDPFKDFAGTKYEFIPGEIRTYNIEDLQSFTLSRFMPPELTNYRGKAIVIDPDIFALTNVTELFDIDLGKTSIAACRKKDAWDTSVMLMDCTKLTHWNIKDMLNMLAGKKATYNQIMTLKNEPEGSIKELPRIWNHLDTLELETKMIHMTGRLTQPWKTGLRIDFTQNKMPKLFGFIPREPVHKLLGKYDTHYKQHPNKKIEKLFFDLTRDALKAGAVSEQLIQSEIENKHVRTDLLDVIKQ